MILFFRNDDVRNKLDYSLIEITNIFMEKGIPITHAVEPANITEEVVSWLNSIKKQYPNLIEIMQHGYDHKHKNKIKKGEFGGQRGYEEQFKDIEDGKTLMDKYFGDLWFPAFNFPYGPYNPAAMKAVHDCGFKVVNSHYNNEWKRQIFYKLGHLLRKGYLFKHHVSWNLDYYPGTKLFEIDMNVGFIDKYYNEEFDSKMMTLDELIEDTRKYFNQKTIGVLLHHRYHNTREKIQLVDDYLRWCKTLQNIEFCTMESIYNTYAKL